MSELTETEIFDCLVTNFRLAAENCKRLATEPLKGRNYDDLRSELLLIEGACRQAANWRADTRWLRIGAQCAQAHKLSQNWLVTYKFKPKFLYELFSKLSEFLKFGLDLAEDMKKKKTGSLGPILPEYMQKSNWKKQESTGPRITSGGIYIPDGVNI